MTYQASVSLAVVVVQRISELVGDGSLFQVQRSCQIVLHL
jgi:hypothetical protein